MDIEKIMTEGVVFKKAGGPKPTEEKIKTKAKKKRPIKKRKTLKIMRIKKIM